MDARHLDRVRTIDRLCSVCGLPVHRYSPDHEGSGTDLMGCVNSLRGEIERLRGALRGVISHWDEDAPQFPEGAEWADFAYGVGMAVQWGRIVLGDGVA